MTLLAYIVIPLIGLTLAASEIPRDDVTNVSSTVSPSEEVFATDSNCGHITSNGSQSECTNDTSDECGVCKPLLIWTCIDGHYADITGEEDAAQQVLNVILYVGFSVSLIACIVANVIYIMTRRGLKGSPYHVHWNLIASFTIYHVVFLIDYSILPMCYVTNMHARNVLHVLAAYAVLANFFWMLVEGLILFGIVVISFFKEQKGRQFIKWCLLGWGAPAVLVIIWIVLKRLTLTGDCRVLELKVEGTAWPNIVCLVVPVLVILLINGVVLVIVIRNINRKLRACDRRDERKRHRRTAKSTLVLLVLLGSYYALPIVAALIENPCLMVYIVTYLARIISSMQGLAVTTLYVFRNGEVRRLLNKRFDRLDMSWKSGMGSTRMSSLSSSKRNSSSSGSDASKARRSTAGTVPGAAMLEMDTAPTKPLQPAADVNYNKPAAGGREDNRILMEPPDTQDGQKSTRSGSGYTKLDTTDPDEERG
ncbi:secretin receptor-like isoform X2 [Patiria miniata]|uniref:G-protein coupled receptors family 2 profile 2 domain-containing protein n=1 Tax=Patiria miniata TaxID=46514 RepID=A0A914B6B4_PATMI|nr:secretin receptor-like isoform X2 [Patiria miniata]